MTDGGNAAPNMATWAGVYFTAMLTSSIDA